MVFGAASYAYFFANAETKDQKLVTESGTIRIRFSDNDNEVKANLNFGESVTKEFILENTGTLDAKIKLVFKNLINTYSVGSLSYKLEYKKDENSSEYILVQNNKNVPCGEIASDRTIINNLDVPVKSKYYYRLTITLEHLKDVDQTSDIDAFFSSTFIIEEPSKSIVDDIIANANQGRPNFVKSATIDEGVFAMKDDYGTSYYYRGTVENNYLKYGKNKSGEDMWWRIVRINGDGSLRIIYDGTKAWKNGESSNERLAKIYQPWNGKYNANNMDNKYVGWMFGGAQGEASTSVTYAHSNQTNSEVKTEVDKWFKENIVDTGYSENIVDEIFCNDREVVAGLGYGENITNYSGYKRFNSTINQQPKFTCSNKNDAFTVNESTAGNGDLIYPVGLLTADEVVAAGMPFYGEDNYKHYLYKTSRAYNWTMTPYKQDLYAHNFMFHYSLNYTFVDNLTCGFSPVINLSAEYVSTLMGDGMIDNPYRSESVNDDSNGFSYDKIIARAHSDKPNFIETAPRITYDMKFSAPKSSNTSSLTSGYFVYADNYKFNPLTKKFTLSSPKACLYSSCYRSLNGKYIILTVFKNYPSSTDLNNYTANQDKIFLVDGTPTLNSIKYMSSSIKEISDYSKDGIYSLEDDYGTSYYYRGAVTDNYLKYGKDKDNQNMYWRIVRINGDGSLRIAYDGTIAHNNGDDDDTRFAIVDQQWNTNENDNKYIGWMFGGAQGEVSTSREDASKNETNTEAKSALDKWYKENILDTGYAENVVDRVFCNDRSLYQGTGFGNTKTVYGAAKRIGFVDQASVDPKFTCEEKNDAFTVEETATTNGKLTYPVGLLTADELVAAGGKWNSKNDLFYLYKSSYYRNLSMSPGQFSTNGFILSYQGEGYLNGTRSAYNRTALTPVINLSKDYVNTLIGSGKLFDPYRAPGVEA